MKKTIEEAAKEYSQVFFIRDKPVESDIIMGKAERSFKAGSEWQAKQSTPVWVDKITTGIDWFYDSRSFDYLTQLCEFLNKYHIEPERVISISEDKFGNVFLVYLNQKSNTSITPPVAVEPVKSAKEMQKRFKELVKECHSGMNQLNIGTWTANLKDWHRIYDDAIYHLSIEYAQQFKPVAVQDEKQEVK